ncbi:MAG: hypothetical protein OEM26_00035 [Saprospiraceae bacterium]|nr:hypothetical protein [Saprospiraceae bacterium]
MKYKLEQMNPVAMKFLLTLFFLVTLWHISSAQLNAWVGLDGDWNIGANWSQGTVPDAIDSVVIDSNTVTIPSGFQAVGKYILTKLGSSLVIADNGSLSIAGSTNDPAILIGSFTNNGLLHIDGSNAGNNLGLRFGGLSVNNDSIILVNANGLTNGGTLENNGLIEIGLFSQMQVSAVQNSLKLTNNGTIIVNGTNATSSNGLLSLDTLINTGTICIENIDGSQAHGIRNEGYLHNSGWVSIREILGSTANGIQNRDTIVNAGKITVENVFQFNNIDCTQPGAGIFNEDSICIKNDPTYESTGIDIFAPDNFLFNMEGGSIVIEGINGTATEGIHNGGDLTNHGKITLLNQSERLGIINVETFTNHDTIAFINFSGMTGILNGDIFCNESSGKVLFKDFSGFAIDNSDTLINHGMICIDTFTSATLIQTSIGLFYNNGLVSIQNDQNVTTPFFNKTNGHVHNDTAGVLSFRNLTMSQALNNSATMTNDGLVEIIDGTSDQNKINMPNAASQLTNNGDIILTNLGGIGFSLSNAISLVNADSGLIRIDSISGSFMRGIVGFNSEIVNSGRLEISNNFSSDAINISGTSSLTNDGYITLSNIAGSGVWASASVTNKECGIISLDKELRVIGSGVFTNRGSIFQNYNGGNIFSNPGISSGLLIDRQESFNGANYTNNGLLFIDFTDTVNCLDTIFNISAGPNDSTIAASPNVYLDEDKTIVAGTIDLTNNWIVLSEPSASATAVYAEFTFSSGCKKVLPLSLENPVEPCGSINIWTGNISSDWHVAGNWSLNDIPIASDNVLIPNGSTVVIQSGMTGLAAVLTVDINASFTVDGELNVQN